jgi:polyisoprenoid-binding protein YceI
MTDDFRAGARSSILGVHVHVVYFVRPAIRRQKPCHKEKHTMTIMSAVPVGLTAGTWTFDVAHSEVAFTVRHMGLFKVRGSFERFSGSITVDPELEKCGATVEVEMASVGTRDANRDNHLRSADFFDVENHPTMTFVGDRVVTDGEAVLLAGELTIRGVTRPFALTVESTGIVPTDPMGKRRAGFIARGDLRRSDFGMTFNIPMEGTGVMIGDRIDVYIELQAILDEEAPAGS